MTRPNFDHETQLKGVCLGVDEAGCGPWAGPVIAAAACLHRDMPLGILERIHDSKKLSPSVREQLVYAFIHEVHPWIQFGIGEATIAEIDTLNIREATKLAMSRAVQNISCPYDHILVDGNRMPDFLKPSHLIIKGDQKSYGIAAASILAKVTRDRIMRYLDAQFPEYKWSQNVGYGTALHQRVIQEVGITPYHRQSFSPIRNYKIQHNIDIQPSNETIYSKIDLSAQV